jgi:hypothetical protein
MFGNGITGTSKKGRGHKRSGKKGKVFNCTQENRTIIEGWEKMKDDF